MTNYTTIHHDASRKSHLGFSLVELIVAMTIGLLLMLGLVSMVINTNRSYGELNKESLRLENGRYALQILSDDIQHAGFYGEYYDIGLPPAVLPDSCDTTITSLQSTLPLFIQGYDAPANSPLDCLPNSNHLPGTDILVIRRVSTIATDVNNLKDNSGKVYLQGRVDNIVLNTAVDNTDQNKVTFNLTKKDAVTRADIHELYVAIYFISPCSSSTCSSSADGGNPIPTLKRIELTKWGTNTVMRTFSLIEGIENLQIEYGIDRSGDGAPNESSSGAGDAYVTNPANIAEWSNVAALRLFLVARSIERSAGYQDAKIYNLGQAGTVGPLNDAYKRHVFSTVIRVTNPSSRRETP